MKFFVIFIIFLNTAVGAEAIIDSWTGEYDFGTKSVTAATTTIKFKKDGSFARISLDTRASALFSMFNNDTLTETSYLQKKNGKWKPYKYVYKMKQDGEFKSVKQFYDFDKAIMTQNYNGKRSQRNITEQTYDRVSILLGLAELLQEKLTDKVVAKRNKIQMADFKDTVQKTFIIHPPNNIKIPYGEVKAYKIAPVKQQGLTIVAFYAIINSKIVLVKLEQYKNGKFTVQAALNRIK
jgi:hypothetical protein